jgi:hypothetical protein
MKVRLILFSLFFCFSALSSIAQTQIYAATDGAWDTNTGSVNNIWSTDKNAVVGTVGLRPTASDDVFTNGKLVSVDVNVSCRNLYVSHNTANSLSIGSLKIITVTGTLSGWDVAADMEEFPNTNVISFASGSSLVFTASNIQPAYDPYVVYFWDASVPLGRATFNFGSGVTKNVIISLDFGTLARIQSGTLSVDPGAVLSGSGATLRIDANASLVTDDPIGSFNSITCTGSINTTNTISAANLTINSGGSLTTSSTISLTNNFTINSGGQVNSSNGITTVNTSISGTCNTSSFLNTSTNFTLGSTGLLATTFNGATQTEGWWSSTNRPGGSVTIDASSTVNFSATANQNVPLLTFGNLTLSGSGTKTVSGTGSLIITGNLTNNSSSATFNVPTQEVLFSGAAANQVISGSGPITFSNGIEVDKSSGSLTLNRALTVANGVTVTSGTLNLGSQTLTLPSGNISNSGTFTPGTSTVIVNGSTSIAGSVSFNHLSVGASGTFTAPTGTLNIAGNLTNNGAFNANSGTLAFNGSQDQSISGTVTINNLTVNNTGTNGVGISGNVNLIGRLTISSGKFDADGIGGSSGLFTIKSSSVTSGGSIGTLSSPSAFSGNISIERFIDGPADWRYLSMPLLTTSSGGTTNVGQWKAYFPVTGEFSDPSPTGSNGVVCSDPASVNCASIFTFDPSLGASGSYVDVGSGGTVASTALDYRTGYSAYTYLSGSFTLSVSGSPVSGDVSIPLKTGYNLIPNPYPSPIDWDLITTSNTTNTIYFTTGQGSFATYLKGNPCTGCSSFNSGWTGEVAIGQAFWIESTGATSLPLTETSKVTSATFVREAAPRDYFRVTLKTGAKEDDAIIRFSEGATDSLEYALDAKKRKNFSFINLSSYNGDPSLDYAINTIPFISCTGSVKLNVTNVAVGSHALKFTELETITRGYEISLLDKFTNTTTKVESNSEYAFEVTSDTASFGAGRFELNVVSPEVDVARDLLISSTQECNSQFVRVDLNNSQNGIQYVFKAGDSALHPPVIGDGDNAFALIDKSLLDFGLNKLNLVASSLDGCNAHIFNEAISVRFDEIKEITSTTSAQTCGEGQVTLSASGASTNGFYKWYEAEDAIEAIPGEYSSALTTPVLTTSKMYYVTAVNASGCESFVRAPVEAKVVTTNKPLITAEGNTLVVNAKTGIQWLKNGSAINGATGPQYDMKSEGIYSVSVTKDGCTTVSDAFEYVVSSVEEKGTVHGYTLSPNPTTDILFVNTPENSEVSVKIYDSKGRKLNITGQRVNAHQMSFDLKESRDGLYLVNIQTSNKLVQLKAIKR